jgi:glycosyltransferase 2 family protein
MAGRNVSARLLLVRLAQGALLALILWGIYRVLAPELDQLSWADLTRWRPAAMPLLASFGLLVAVYVGHALLWRQIMRDLSIGAPTVRTTIRVYFTASLGRYLPGKLWQLAGLAVLARQAGLPPGRAAAAAVLGQFGFLTTGLLYLGITLPEWDAALGVGSGGAGTGPLTLGAVLLITGGAVMWMLVATPLGHGFRAWMARRAGARAAEGLGAAFHLADSIRPRNAMVWAAGYALSWIVLGIAFMLFVAAFEPTAVAMPRYLGGAVAAAYLAGYLFVLAPAGIGVREAAMLILLQRVMPDAAGALVVSALSRVWFTAAELAPLALVPMLRHGSTVEEEESG